MATRTPIECPLCHADVMREQTLEDHLLTGHTKRNLAKFVVAEAEALIEEDISE